MQGAVALSKFRMINAVMLAGIIGTLTGAIGIRLAQDTSWIRIFDNLHWTTSTSTAAIVAWLVFRSASVADRKGLFWIALGLTGYAVGQILWDVQVALAYTGFPAPSDLFYLWLGLCVIIGLLKEISRYTTPSQRKMAWLDATILTVALLTLVLALYLPKRGDTSWLPMLVLIAYPTTLLAAAITALSMIPSLRLRVNGSLLLFVGGLIATGLSWMHWNFLALDGVTIDGSWFNPSFSVAVLLIAFALTGWKIEINTDREWDLRCEAALRMLPMMTVVVAAAAVVLSHTLDLPHIVQVIADMGAVIVLVLAMFRQGALMKEREQLYALQAEFIVSQNKLVLERGQLKTLVSTIPDLVWLKDANGVYLSCNPMFEKLYGHPEAEIVGKTDYDFVSSELADFFRHNDLAAIEAKVSRINEEELSFAVGGYSGLFETIKTPMYDENDNLIGVLGIARGISERKRAEEEIASQQKELSKLSQALEQAGEAVMIASPEAIIEYVNPAFTEITGYSYAEAIGQNTSMLKSGAQDPATYRELWQTIAAGKRWQGTLIDRRKDGSFFPSMISIAPVFNEDKKPTHYVSIMKDITELKRMEHQLLQAQKMEAVGTLVGGIAHDFNNMLAAIQGNLYIAMKNLDDKQLITNKLKLIDEISGDAAEVVRQMLAFAKKDIVEVKTINLNNLLGEGFRLARSTTPENINHQLHLCDDILNVDADATQLKQVIINLSNNARDALEGVPKPSIEWHLKLYKADETFMNRHPEIVDRQMAMISLKDNGCGIKSQHLDVIFDPFFTTKETGKGTGLGLAMVFGSIQRLGGVLEVKSEPGEGTTFFIYIPLSKSTPVLPQADAESALIGGDQQVVLLVDDDENLRMTTAEVLEGFDYKVIEAGDGEEALAKYLAHQSEIAIIFSDVVMPKMGGIELAEEIRKLDAEIPIILATGYDKERVTSGKADFVNCKILTKPFSFERLGQFLRHMLG